MPHFRVQSGTQQVATLLREQLLKRRWSGTMPGRSRLASEFGISGRLIDGALVQLEKEGLLQAGGPRKRRRIRLSETMEPTSLRVAIQDFAPSSRLINYRVDLFHRLLEEEHSAFPARQSLTEIRMDLSRIARQTRETPADAWIVISGSREVLEWFASQPVPVFALFGRRHNLPIAAAGPDKPAGMLRATRRLLELGHRRIVLLARSNQRMPKPGVSERVFLAELDANGLEPSAYNLPDWKETADGFQDCLKQLLRVTPPTALIIDEVHLFNAAMQFLARHNIRVPEDISLICTDGHPDFIWYRPTVAHINWDSRPVVRRILNWASNISQSRIDIEQTITRAEFIEGGTIGPARP
jgi:DNA-binding LacI/PurR family transcriptional regulator